MSHKVKNFYEKAFSGDYCGDMPKWLAKEADKEFSIIKSMILEHNISGNVVDFGCGDGRILRWINLLNNMNLAHFKHKWGIDIITKPRNFPNYASYIKDDNTTTPLKKIDRPYELIDLLVSVGVSVHLDCLELRLILSHILLNIKPKAHVIWQLNHRRTLRGKWLNWSSKIEYKYHDFKKTIEVVNNFNKKNVDSIHQFKITDKQETKISDIYLLEKHEKI